MVKHTQTNRRQQPKNCLSVFDNFVGLTHKGLIQIVEKSDTLSICFVYCKSEDAVYCLLCVLFIAEERENNLGDLVIEGHN